MQKLMGDYYRYAYESTLIERYVEPEAPGTPDSPSPIKVRDQDDTKGTHGTNSVDITNDDESPAASKLVKNVQFVEANSIDDGGSVGNATAGGTEPPTPGKVPS